MILSLFILLLAGILLFIAGCYSIAVSTDSDYFFIYIVFGFMSMLIGGLLCILTTISSILTLIHYIFG